MPIDPPELQEYLHGHIPISREMEVRVKEAGASGVRLAAPLEPNINHHSTAFGGSVSALAILSAWTLVHAHLREIGSPARIVIQRNSVEYLRPVHGPFEAWCPSPDPAAWGRFVETLSRRGRARISLRAEVLENGQVAGRFEGAFVALAGSSPEE